MQKYWCSGAARTRIGIVMLLVFCCAFLCPELRAEEIAIPAFDGEGVVQIHDGVPFLTADDMDLLPEQYYGELDSLGRCTGAYACIGSDTLAEGARENISGVEPTGWQVVQYGEKGEYLYNRCHLIGYQLTGQNANERNLITGTNYLNTTEMKPYEDMVYQYVSGTGNHVLYRVTPLFHGDNLLADGVLMEGRSVEDDRIAFCVFCYNIQPGVELDYATGMAAGEGVSLTLLPAGGDAGEDIPDRAGVQEEETEQKAVPGSGEVTYVANRNTKKFHYPYCDSVQDMKKKNRIDFEGTREELIDMGYEPCKRCNP